MKTFRLLFACSVLCGCAYGQGIRQTAYTTNGVGATLNVRRGSITNLYDLQITNLGGITLGGVRITSWGGTNVATNVFSSAGSGSISITTNDLLYTFDLTDATTNQWRVDATNAAAHKIADGAGVGTNTTLRYPVFVTQTNHHTGDSGYALYAVAATNAGTGSTPPGFSVGNTLGGPDDDGNHESVWFYGVNFGITGGLLDTNWHGAGMVIEPRWNGMTEHYFKFMPKDGSDPVRWLGIMGNTNGSNPLSASVEMQQKANQIYWYAPGQSPLELPSMRLVLNTNKASSTMSWANMYLSGTMELTGDKTNDVAATISLADGGYINFYNYAQTRLNLRIGGGWQHWEDGSQPDDPVISGNDDLSGVLRFKKFAALSLETNLYVGGSLYATGNVTAPRFLGSISGTYLDAATVASNKLSFAVASPANPLSQFASTTSEQLAGVLSDETGSGGGGVAVFSTSPQLTGTFTFDDASGDNLTLTGNIVGTFYGDAANVTNAVNLAPGANVTITTNANGRLWTIASSATGSSDFTNNPTSLLTWALGNADGTAQWINPTNINLTINNLTVNGTTTGVNIDGSNVVSGTVAAARLGSGSSITTKVLRGDNTWQAIGAFGVGLTANPLSQFASTTSAQLAGVMSDETGTAGSLVFSGSPSITTPNLTSPRTIGTNYIGGFFITTNVTGGLSFEAESWESDGAPMNLAADGILNATGFSGNAASLTNMPASSLQVGTTFPSLNGVNLTNLTYKMAYPVACSDTTTDITTGTAKVTFRMPFAGTLTAVRASCSTAPTGSTIIIDINEGVSSVLGTKLSIDASEKTSTTAASQATITDSSLADDAEITIDFDQVGSSTPGKGVIVVLYFTATP